MVLNEDKFKVWWKWIKQNLQYMYCFIIMNNEIFEEVGLYWFILFNVYVVVSIILVLVVFLVVIVIVFILLCQYVFGYGEGDKVCWQVEKLYDEVQLLE